ncbi:Bug family tripartite tricarboxylate transporter substrate binding protein [Mesorhizobium sp. ZMM04-4]
MNRCSLRLLAAAIVSTFIAFAARADSGADFFNGKTITYVVSTDPGGGYDANGRLVAEFMQKHLPGSTIVVRNMPGAGQIIGANFIYAAEPDGLTIGTFNTGLIYAQLADKAGIRFDLSRMSWIGKVASDPRVVVVSEQSGIADFSELAGTQTTLKFAAPGVGSASAIETALLVSALGLPIKIITGYNGDEDQLAMMRGEVQGTLGSRSSFQRFVDEGHGKLIAQIGGSQTDVPLLETMITDEAGRKVLSLVQSQGSIARVTAGPPGIPADRLDALRAAYAAATSDPAFLAKAKQLGLPVDPATGDELAGAVAKALNQTPEMVRFLKYNTK